MTDRTRTITQPGRLLTSLRDRQLFASPEDRRRFVIHAVLAGVALATVTVLVGPRLAFLTDAAEIRRIVQGFGVWGPLALIALQASQVVLAPVPGQVLAVVAGYLYGPWWGTLYNLLGIVLGSTIAFWLAKRFGRPYVASIVHEDVLAGFDAIDDDHIRVALFVMFLVPGLPDDALCFVGGLTRIPLWQLVVLAAVGRAPAFFLVNVVGDLFGTGRAIEGLVLAGAVVAVSVIAYLHRGRLVGYLLTQEG